MPATTNLLGKQFGRLTVVEKITEREIKGVPRKGIWWRAECNCGGEAISTTNALINSVRNCKDCKSNDFRNEWLNKVVSTKSFGDFKVLSIENNLATVEFIATGYKTAIRFKELKLGKVKDPTAPHVSGVGYLGIGDYTVTDEAFGKKRNSDAYEVWNGMLKRCYNKEWQSKQGRTSYIGVTVAPEWHCFQNFAKWYYDNRPTYEDFALDKDLKIIGNREYSPEVCTFVPVQVNSLFTGTQDDRDLPRGVHFCNTKKKFIVQLHNGELTKNGNNKQSYLGAYDDVDLAIKVYRDAKVKHCSDVAEKYKDKLEETVYYNLKHRALDFI